MTAGVAWELADADATRALGAALAGLLRAGDLVVLVGDLGAGKTTLVQGLGAQLQVRGAITSPTFVIARRHPASGTGPDLVHVDAYRVGSAAQIDDLDLGGDGDDAITVVEWGAGLVEHLADSVLVIRLDQDPTLPGRRTAVIEARGPRWDGVDIAGMLAR